MSVPEAETGCSTSCSPPAVPGPVLGPSPALHIQHTYKPHLPKATSVIHSKRVRPHRCYATQGSSSVLQLNGRYNSSSTQGGNGHARGSSSAAVEGREGRGRGRSAAVEVARHEEVSCCRLRAGSSRWSHTGVAGGGQVCCW